MEIYTGIDQIKQLPIFTQLDHPVALTAPLIADDEVIIGLYCELTGSACIHIDTYKFIDLKRFLYDPIGHRVLVHGIKRIWENHQIGSLFTSTNLVSDTEMIAYLLDSGREEHEYSLSYLSHKYLDINYPSRSAEICDKGYPEALYEILSDDACLIWELASVLLDRMDDDLMEVYFFGELKIALILNEMSRTGIPVDGQAAAQMCLMFEAVSFHGQRG
jgi:DNA polymerase I-like protein with 3'-5' exonuclease and polymerase domains